MKIPLKTFGPARDVAPDPKHKILLPVISSNWSTADHRMLLLIERPDPLDVQQKTLMSPSHGTGRDTVINATTNSINGLINWSISESPDIEQTHAFGVALFSSVTWDSMLAELKPTKVLLMGFKSTGHIFPDKPNLIYTHGNPHKRNGVLYCTTLPLDQLLYKKDDNKGGGSEDTDASRSDLLYTVARAMSNLAMGRNPESLSRIKANPNVIGTMEGFYKLLEELKEAKEWGLDIETKNLSSYKNKVFTMQFATSEDVGHLLPIQHPNSPFTEEEQFTIRKHLRKLICDPKLPYGRKLIAFFNGKFDMRVLRAWFRVAMIPHHIWEVQGAEHLLDENLGLLDQLSFRGAADMNIKIRAGNLRNMFCLYGNDSYYCVAEGQLVKLSDGSRKPIQEIEIGDRVVTYNTDSSLISESVVTHKGKTPVKKRLVKITHEQGTLIVTEDHLVWSADRKKYVEAGKLLKGERLVVD